MLEKNIHFYLLVLRSRYAKKLYELQKKYKNKNIPLKEIRKVNADFAELTLTPVGKGALKINLPKKYEEISSEKLLKIKVDVENNGSIAVQNVRIVANAPSGWAVTFDPKSIDLIDIKEKEYFTIEITIPGEITIGQYDVAFYAEGEDRGTTIESDDTIFTVKKKEKSSFILNFIIILLVVGFTVFVALFTIKMAKR